MEPLNVIDDYGEYKIESVETDKENNTLHIYLELKKDSIICNQCKTEVKYVREKYERIIRDLPIGEHIIVKLHYPVKIFECSKCKGRHTVKLSLVESGQFATTRFKLYIGKLATLIPPSQLAQEFNLDDNTDYRYEDYFLKKSFHR